MLIAGLWQQQSPTNRIPFYTNISRAIELFSNWWCALIQQRGQTQAPVAVNEKENLVGKKKILWFSSLTCFGFPLHTVEFATKKKWSTFYYRFNSKAGKWLPHKCWNGCWAAVFNRIIYIVHDFRPFEKENIVLLVPVGPNQYKTNQVCSSRENPKLTFIYLNMLKVFFKPQIEQSWKSFEPQTVHSFSSFFKRKLLLITASELKHTCTMNRTYFRFIVCC